jgi:hypothetical protein
VNAYGKQWSKVTPPRVEGRASDRSRVWRELVADSSLLFEREVKRPTLGFLEFGDPLHWVPDDKSIAYGPTKHRVQRGSVAIHRGMRSIPQEKAVKESLNVSGRDGVELSVAKRLHHCIDPALLRRGPSVV